MRKLASCPGLFIAILVVSSGMGVSLSQNLAAAGGQSPQGLDKKTTPARIQSSVIDQEHTKWIDKVMRTIQTIKPGMVRGDLKKMFAEEGGLSARRQRKYVYKTCPYIKVDVEFAPSDNDMSTEKPEDKIVSISRPYLEYSIMD